MLHMFKLYDTNIVIDVNSGAVHVFDDVSYDVLKIFDTYGEKFVLNKLLPNYSKDEIEESLDEIKALIKNGELYSEDEYERHRQLWDKKPVVKALCIHICHDCNLRCKYCFAGTGDFGGIRTMMTPNIGKKAIDFLIEQSQNRKNLEIDFFGGEPLMNFETVRAIVEYALMREKETGKKFKFTITTNALLLNEDNKQYINKHMQNVVLSIDGRKKTNDTMRLRVDKTGTYDTILPKIKDMADSREQDNYYVRGTFTRENLDFSEDVLHLADLGFEQISVEPVVAAKDSGYDLRHEDMHILKKEYDRLALEYVKRKKEGKGFNFFHFNLDLSQGPCVAKRLGGCGAGHEYLAVTPEGDIYPCHQFVGMEQFKMGDVQSKDVKSNIQYDFKNSHVYSKKECRECWAKFYCSGGCSANANQFNNNINVPYDIGCELERKRLECALWINSQLNSGA